MVKQTGTRAPSAPSGLDQNHITQIYLTIRTAIRSATTLGIIYVLSLALAPFAGHSTAITFALSILADIKFAAVASVAGVATVWALIERNAKHKKTEYLQDRIKQLEQNIDPQRSSSGLAPSGRTNPKDKTK